MNRQGDKQFLNHKDQESKELLAKHGISSVVVNELRERNTAIELARFVNSQEHCCWNMYKMRRRFMDGCSGALWNIKHDAKNRGSDEQAHEDDDGDGHGDDDENDSIIH